MKALPGLLVVAALSVSAFAADNAVVPTAEKYLDRPFSHDVAASLARGVAEHKPVWIVAWDEKFIRGEGRKDNVAAYSLGYFYQNPDTKKLVAKNFIQVFTTMNNKDIQQWLDPSNKTHDPVFIVIDASGKFVTRKAHYANPEEGLKMVQAAIAGLNQPAPNTAVNAPAGSK